MAAVAVRGDGALVSHGTAGLALGHRGRRASRGRAVGAAVEEDRGRGSHAPPWDAARPGRPRRSSGPIPITTPVRTLIDLSARMEDDRLLAAMERRGPRGAWSTARTARSACRGLAPIGPTRRGPPREHCSPAASQRPALESDAGGQGLAACSGDRGCRCRSRQFWVVAAGWPLSPRLRVAGAQGRARVRRLGAPRHPLGVRRDRARLAEFAAARWRILPVTWKACTRESERVERWLRNALAVAA